MHASLQKHQSYGIRGTAKEVLPELLRMLGGLPGNIGTNPDHHHKKFETLTIDDAREIKEIHAGRPFSADIPRVFIIEFHGITREAQNALLKVLEEPAPNNFFFLIMPSFDILLPTLRSRLHSLDFDEDEKAQKKADSFLTLSVKEKVAKADAIAQSISDEAEAKHVAMEFVAAIELELYEAYSKENSPQKKALFAEKFEIISKARTYLNDRAPSIKMLLEYVALGV